VDVSAVPTPPPQRILIVEDNRDDAETLAQLLSLLGHEVRTAHDGPAGLEIARAFPPHVVLLDIGLPGLDGYEVARRLRRELKPAPVLVAVTGHNEEEDRRRSQEAGIDYHLAKPADPEQLLTLLAQPPAGRRRATRVLVVEDEPAILAMLDLALRFHGFEVQVAPNGHEAVRVYEQRGPDIDLVLMDVQMPGDLDGPATLGALRRLNPHVRCAFMSGNTGRYSGEELLALGASCVLAKPFANLALLADHLRNAAGIRH
jgi:CheY-like chemotaxis protein